MTELTRFEDPFRPLVEVWAVGGWAVAAVGTLIVAYLMPYPAQTFVMFAVACMAMAVWRALPAMRLAKVQASMGGTDITFMTREDLRKVTKNHPNELFLGYGFSWTQAQAQVAYTMMRHDPERLAPRAAGAMGQAWIHGIGVLEESALFMPIEHAGTHTLLVGTTGSGKTRDLDILIAQTIAMGHSLVIIDPKGDRDLCEAARAACIELGRPEDFVYFHPAHPEVSVRIDPLKNFNRGTELATRVAAILPSEGGDPFTAFSQMALNKLCEAMLMIHEKPSLVLFRRLLESGIASLVARCLEVHFEKVKPGRDEAGQELPGGWIVESRSYTAQRKNHGEEGKAQAYIQYYRDCILHLKASSAVEGVISLFEHDSSHMSKMITGLMPVLNMLTSGWLGALLSPDYEDPDDRRPITDLGKITRSGQVAYIGLDSLSDGMVASAIGSMLLSDLTAVAGDRYNFQDPASLPRVSVFVDEAAEVLNAPLVQLLNKGRGSGFSIYLATQTLSDITTRLGSKDLALKVLGNINNVIALRCNDTATQEYIAESFPQAMVRKVDVGYTSRNETDDPLTFSASMSESLAEEEVALVPAQMLACLPNLQGFARVSGGRVLKWRVPILRAAPAVPPR